MYRRAGRTHAPFFTGVNLVEGWLPADGALSGLHRPQSRRRATSLCCSHLPQLSPTCYLLLELKLRRRNTAGSFSRRQHRFGCPGGREQGS